MRPEDFVIGQERSRRLRGFLQEREEQFTGGEAESYDEQISELRVDHRSHHDDVLAAVRAIFSDRDARPLRFDELDLTVQERSALESLRTAHAGKDARTNLFVFAEQRREMLEQALAALQPMLALDINAVPEFRDTYDELLKQVGDLRERLTNLEDAQDDEMLHYVKAAAKAAEGEDGDGDGDKDDDGDDGAAEPAVKPSTLSQPDGEAPDVEWSAKPSTLEQGEALEPAVRPSTLYQPDDEAASSAAEPSSAKAAPGKGGVFSRLGRALGLGGKGEDDQDPG